MQCIRTECVASTEVVTSLRNDDAIRDKTIYKVGRPRTLFPECCAVQSMPIPTSDLTTEYTPSKITNHIEGIRLTFHSGTPCSGIVKGYTTNIETGQVGSVGGRKYCCSNNHVFRVKDVLITSVECHQSLYTFCNYGAQKRVYTCKRCKFAPKKCHVCTNLPKSFQLTSATAAPVAIISSNWPQLRPFQLSSYLKWSESFAHSLTTFESSKLGGERISLFAQSQLPHV